MPDLIIIFRAHSDIEASVVRGLLEAHGIPSVLASDVPHSVFPLTISTLAEVRISVNQDDADEARRIIESHRIELPGGRVLRLRDEFDQLQRGIGYRFRDVGLLEHAMTHTSRANEDVSGGVVDNESLEFLGDAVLGFAIADQLFRDFPEFDEGQKSKTKAALVSTAALAQQAERLGLGDHLLLGRGEEKTGGRRKQALLADGYEALIAAIYLDGGIEQARAFIAREFAAQLEDISRHGLAGRDYKSSLQEYLQSHDQPLPEYRVAGTLGPDHRKLFQVEVVVRGEAIATATGPSKKEAEQEAARAALGKLGIRN
ncbi:MAG: ribonuclease III [Acidobacteriota bacterium]